MAIANMMQATTSVGAAISVQRLLGASVSAAVLALASTSVGASLYVQIPFEPAEDDPMRSVAQPWLYLSKPEADNNRSDVPPFNYVSIASAEELKSVRSIQ